MKKYFSTFYKTLKPLASVALTGFLIAAVSACGGGGGGGGPTTPGVSSVNPANGATNVSKTTVVTATFSDGMDETDLAANIQAEFTLVDNSLTSISGVAAYDDTLNVARFNPDMNLGVLKGYTASLGAGGTITHSGGTVMPEYTWSFTTAEGAWGSAENIEMDGTSNFSSPKVAVGGNGDAMAVWLDVTGGTRYIYYNKYSSSIPGWGNSQILTTWGYQIDYLRVAMDHNGNAMAIWRQDTASPSMNLYASYYNGTLWSATAPVEGISGVVSEPQVAFDASGNAIAAWLHDTSIYVNRYTGSWGTEQEIDTGANAAVNPQLAVFGNGNAIVVWAQSNGSINIIYASHYNATGDTWSAPTPLSNTEGGAIPQVAVNDRGEAIVVWLQGASLNSVYAAVYDGSSWEPSALLDSDAHANTIPQVGIDYSGNWIALWKENPLTNSPARLRYRMSGSVLGDIDNGVSDTSDPKLVMDDEGHVIVVWRQYTNDTTDTVYSTWSNRYQSGASNWGTPGRIETVDYETATGTVPAPVTSLHLGMNKYNGTAFAIWLQDQDGSTVNSVWVNHFD